MLGGYDHSRAIVHTAVSGRPGGGGLSLRAGGYLNFVKQDGQSLSLWSGTAEMPFAPELTADREADVCVVGAGIAGLTTAYLLAKNGQRVIVLDRARLGGRQTPQTTAHVTAALDDRYSSLEKLHGEDGARLAAQSHTAAIRCIEQVVAGEKIDCGLETVDAYLYLAPGDDPAILDDELAAAKRAGLDVDMVDRAPFADPFDTGRAIRWAGQAQFHPLKYLAGLCEALKRAGAELYQNTVVERVHDGSPATVITTTGHTVTARAVVVATNSPINDMVTIHTKQAPYTTYVIGLEIPRGSVPRCLAYDTPDPYHYIRTYSLDDSDTDILIVGGEDDKTGESDRGAEHFDSLDRWARERFPMAGSRAYAWSGQIYEPVDSLAFIGRNPHCENIYIATGDSGNGITHGTIAGMLITNLIGGTPNHWTPVYDPARISLHPEALKEYVTENADVVVQIAQNLTPGEVDSVEAIERGSGAIVRDGAEKIAAYRDDTGKLHRLSANCTHLGCIVHWNSTDKEWDCPCHGSRFAANGEVVNGPAIAPLAPRE